MISIRMVALAFAASLAAAVPVWGQDLVPGQDSVFGQRLAQAPQTGGAPATARPAATAPAAPSTAKVEPAAKPALIDINTASEAELDALPGIGAVRAAAIVKGRPYKGKDDLLRKKVLPSNIYEGIKDRIIAKQA